MWELPANLAQEVSSVEELLTKGGCDSANSRLVLQVRCPKPLFFYFSFLNFVLARLVLFKSFFFNYCFYFFNRHFAVCASV